MVGSREKIRLKRAKRYWVYWKSNVIASFDTLYQVFRFVGDHPYRDGYFKIEDSEENLISVTVHSEDFVECNSGTFFHDDGDNAYDFEGPKKANWIKEGF